MSHTILISIILDIYKLDKYDVYLIKKNIYICIVCVCTYMYIYYTNIKQSRQNEFRMFQALLL